MPRYGEDGNALGFRRPDVLSIHEDGSGFVIRVTEVPSASDSPLQLHQRFLQSVESLRPYLENSGHNVRFEYHLVLQTRGAVGLKNHVGGN